jgi:phage tail sheath protein FI
VGCLRAQRCSPLGPDPPRRRCLHQTLFTQGAFQGSTPQQAYFVKCDSETTTPTDQDNGIVNILVGFAPLKPAEFVIIQIQQIAGQTA